VDPGSLVSGSLVFGGAPIGGLYAPVSDEAARRPAARRGAAVHLAPPGDRRRNRARTAEEATVDVSYL